MVKMKNNKLLSTKISTILLEQCDINKPTDIIQSIDKYLAISEQILSELSLIRTNKKTINNKNKKDDIYTLEKDYNDDIEQIEAIISSSEESGIRDQSNYRKLQHNYYKIINIILNCKNNIFTETMNIIDNKLSLLEDKSKCIEEKFEGIGSTIFSTVVSLTVVVTAITAIEKISAIYIPLYLVSMVWLCMTLIIFINNLFNKKDFNNRQATFLYFVISTLVIILLFGTVFYIMNNDAKIMNNEKSIETIVEK